MKVDFYELGIIADEKLLFAVVPAKINEKWIFVRHKDRNTWEVPGGHRDAGEDIYLTAQRELFEETGALEYLINPVCDYSVAVDESMTYGRLFYADILMLGSLPDSEIAEVKLYDRMPKELTYPLIQPKLYEKVMQWLKNGL